MIAKGDAVEIHVPRQSGYGACQVPGSAHKGLQEIPDDIGLPRRRKQDRICSEIRVHDMRHDISAQEGQIVGAEHAFVELSGRPGRVDRKEADVADVVWPPTPAYGRSRSPNSITLVVSSDFVSRIPASALSNAMPSATRASWNWLQFVEAFRHCPHRRPQVLLGAVGRLQPLHMSHGKVDVSP